MPNTEKFDPPEKEKYQPLDSDEARRFIEAADDHPDNLTRVCGRVFTEIGIRNDELVHARPDWIGESRHPETNKYDWYFQIPKYDYCIGGSGPTGYQNEEGADLHTKGEPCHRCRPRGYKKKSWVSDADAEEYDFHPKTVNAPRSQWFDNSATDIAKTLNAIVEANGQFPILHGAVNRRLQKIADEAGLDRRVTAHALRHTYGCRLSRMGFEASEICDFMGHQDYQQAMWYSEVTGMRKRESMAEKFDSDIV